MSCKCKDKCPVDIRSTDGSVTVTEAPECSFDLSAAMVGSFFALMPPDNAAPIAPGAAVAFPTNGPLTDAVAGIRRSSPSQFILPTPGIYKVTWQAAVDEGALAAGAQLLVGLDLGAGVVEQPQTVAGRNASEAQVSNTVLIRTVVANEILTIRNPAANAPITLTPSAGGTLAVSAWLVIERVSN